MHNNMKSHSNTSYKVQSLHVVITPLILSQIKAKALASAALLNRGLSLYIHYLVEEKKSHLYFLAAPTFTPTNKGMYIFHSIHL